MQLGLCAPVRSRRILASAAVEVQVLETRVDLSNDMTWRQVIGVGVRNVVLARGRLDKLEARGAKIRCEDARVAPLAPPLCVCG